MASLTDSLRWAWQAGFIDGDGTLTIEKQIRKNRPSPAYRAIVEATNTRRRAVERFQHWYGGGIYQPHEYRGDKRGKLWATAYVWHCPDSEIPRLLNDILPYLVIKRECAELILEFIEHKHSFKRKSLGYGGGSAPLGEEEIAFREALYLRVKLLNSKGQYARANSSKGGDAK